MGSHGIRNRPLPPRHRMTDAIQPETPNAWAMVSAVIGIVLILTIWCGIVTLILSH